MDSRNLETVINALGEVIHDRDLTISCLEYRVKALEAENEKLRGGANHDQKEN